jgi:hypothetical protein
MASLFMQEELQQAKAVCEHWLKYFAPKEYVDDVWNRDLMMNYIKYKCGGDVTTENLNAALRANQADLHGLGVAHTPEQKLARAKEIAEKAEAERLEKISAHNVAVATSYLLNRAPSGLLVNGDFYQESADKIIVFLKRNYPNQPITDAMLTEAIETLGFTNGVAGGSLDWFDKSPSAVVFRNVPPPPPRKLSRQAQIDAGMILAESERPSHAKTDGNFNSPRELIQFMAQEELKRRGITEDPEMVAADQISVTNRHGRLDHSFNAQLKKIFAHNRDGSPNGTETKRLRMAAASEYERRRNRDGAQRG